MPETVPASWLLTHRIPLVKDSGPAPSPVAYVATTEPCASTLETTPLVSSDTQAKPPPAAKELMLPTTFAVATTAFVLGSIRLRPFPSAFPPTQIQPLSAS